jgi:hypothetical protein
MWKSIWKFRNPINHKHNGQHCTGSSCILSSAKNLLSGVFFSIAPALDSIFKYIKTIFFQNLYPPHSYNTTYAAGKVPLCVPWN